MYMMGSLHYFQTVKDNLKRSAVAVVQWQGDSRLCLQHTFINAIAYTDRECWRGWTGIRRQFLEAFSMSRLRPSAEQSTAWPASLLHRSRTLHTGHHLHTAQRQLYKHILIWYSLEFSTDTHITALTVWSRSLEFATNSCSRLIIILFLSPLTNWIV